MKKHTCTFQSDSGHGWLSVPHAALRALGLGESTSSYSYMSHSRVYLEEDGDTHTFLKAAKQAGWQLSGNGLAPAYHRSTGKDVHLVVKEGASCDGRSPIRSYGSYCPGLLNAFADLGSGALHLATLTDGFEYRIRHKLVKNHLIVDRPDTPCTYRIPSPRVSQFITSVRVVQDEAVLS